MGLFTTSSLIIFENPQLVLGFFHNRAYVLQNAFPGITIIGVGATRDSQFIPPDKDDPKRGHREVYPVEQLVAWGADHVVVGRPITEGGIEEWGPRAIDIVNRLK